MNAGIAASLLPKNQLAFGTNTTVRGALVGPRAYYRKMLLDFVGGGDIQPASTQALFQGAGYYKPDAGLECLMASVAGRMFQFQVEGKNAHVSEVTNSSFQQSPSATQAWLWQSERWMIFNDGISLPLFFDGSTIRRSLGNSTSIVGTVGPAAYSSPAGGPGSTNTMNLSGPYTGPLPTDANDKTTGVVSVVDSLGASYKFQVTATAAVSGTAFTVSGTSVYSGTAGLILSSNPAQLVKPSGFYAFNITPIAADPNNNKLQDIYMSAPFFGDSSKKLSIGGQLFNIFLIDNNIKRISLNRQGIGPLNTGVPAGQPVTISGDTITFAVVGTVATSNVPEPATGSSFTYNLNAAYTGLVNDYVLVQDQGGRRFQAIINSFATNNTTAYNLTVLDMTLGGAPAGKTFNIGASLVISGQELPAGRMGIYAASRNWVCLTDGISFVASDQVGDSSGTVTYNFRDAVLEMTQNNFLLGGGVFRVPTSGEQIRAIALVPTLDAALGNGPIAVLTPNTVFSCQSPVDRTTWQDITNPILSVSMIDAGAEGQDSTLCANSDLLFRSVSGSRSLILARRDFNTWGNVPISREIDPVLADDDKSLLSYGSAIVFDNRKLETANPIASSLGVYHTKITALNFDPLSSLAGKAPSVYDGIWQDLNVLKLIKGRFAGVERTFAFCLSTDLSTVELWEILPSADAATQDSDGPVTVEFECPVIYREPDLRTRRFKRLINGEIFVDKLVGKVDFQVFYRPDDYPSWIPWHSWIEEAKLDDPESSKPQFRPRMGLGEPSGTPCDNITNRPFREGYYFQVRVVMTGHCQFKGARFLATTIPEPEFANPSPSTL